MESTQSDSQTSAQTMSTEVLKETQSNTNTQVKDSQPTAQNFYFQTETKRLKDYYLTHGDQLVGRKILFNNSTGAVRYMGPLVHQGKPASSKDQLWIGIEWDDLNRGKHNGSVNGHQYFACPENQGSMIKYQKIEFGYKLETALFKRYFKAEQLHNAKSIYQSLKQIKQQFKSQDQTIKKTKCQQAITKKVHKIEYDAEAYFDTIKKTKKIMIEFVGFDEIWTKINNLDKIQSISLADCRICDLGPLGHLNNLFKSLKILSLQDNLLSDWNQVYQLGYELPELTELSLSNNLLHTPTQSFQNIKEVGIVGRQEKLTLQNCKIFPNLKCLILINTNLSWKTFFKVLPAFGTVYQFILCKNNLSDTQNIDENKLNFMSETRFLNLEETKQTNFQKLSAFSNLVHLQKLILNKNALQLLGREIKGYNNLRYLSVQQCDFHKPVVLYQISAFINLQSLNVKHNPIGDKFGNAYVRMRAVAEISKLNQINGALLKKYERKDCQIFYMRQSFRQYFAIKKVPDYDYDFDDFTKYCEKHHPNIQKLIKRYGNPYEVEKQKQIQAIIKEQVKVTENKKGTGMVEVIIQYTETGSVDKKKVPLSWTLSSLKNFFSKTVKIPVGLLILTCFAQNSTQGQQMTEDHKTLSFYNLNSGSKIVVSRRAA